MKIYIKNMVCNRCKSIVQNELAQLNLVSTQVELGEVTTLEEISDKEMGLLGERLHQHGFEILEGRDQKIIERIKNIVVKTVYQDGPERHVNLSEVIAKELNQDYSAVSKLFSETEGLTIEKYLIRLRIERVKELLKYDELTLTEIAHRLNYSSSAYLSNQFKKVTGLSPSFYKQMKKNTRKPIDEF